MPTPGFDDAELPESHADRSVSVDAAEEASFRRVADPAYDPEALEFASAPACRLILVTSVQVLNIRPGVLGMAPSSESSSPCSVIHGDFSIWVHTF